MERRQLEGGRAHEDATDVHSIGTLTSQDTIPASTDLCPFTWNSNWAVRWIRGRLEPNGGVGWFPQTYVERIFEETESVLVEDSASGILVALDKTFLCL